MQETESVSSRSRQFAPIAARNFQECESSDDIGVYEIPRADDRPIDMAFGGEMNEMLRLECGKRLGDGSGVAYIDL